MVFAGASKCAAKQCVGRGWRNQRVAGSVVFIDVIADGGEPEVIVVKGLTKLGSRRIVVGVPEVFLVVLTE